MYVFEKHRMLLKKREDNLPNYRAAGADEADASAFSADTALAPSRAAGSPQQEDTQPFRSFRVAA